MEPVATVDALFASVRLALEGSGIAAYVLAPLLMGVVSVLPLPAEAPAMLNGALFGPWVGSIITWLGAMLGAIVSFELGHRFGAPALERWGGRRALSTAKEMTERSGWAGLLVLRLLPVVAFTAVNWGAGFAGVPRGRFVWTTAIGIIPGVILFTASGSAIANILERTSAPVGWLAVLAVVGFCVYVILRRQTVNS